MHRHRPLCALLLLLPLLLLSACGGSDTPVPGMQMKLQGGPVMVSAAPVVTNTLPGSHEQYLAYQDCCDVTVRDAVGYAPYRHYPLNSRIRFADYSLDFDSSGASASIYRLYRAAFHRTPDVGGISFWLAALNRGMSLNQIAGYFVASPEFRTLYGGNPTYEEIVNNAYRNVLNRAGEPDGVAFWLTYLVKGRITVADMLVYFAESPENKAASKTLIDLLGIPLYEPGVVYTPVAKPGAAQEVLTGTQVTLDGSASTAGLEMSYEWTMLLKPPGSNAQLSSSSSATPSFTPDVAGTYLLSLTVHGPGNTSADASVLVTGKVLPALWRADAGAVPASGNYVYLQGSAYDFISAGRSYLYRQSDTTFGVHANGNKLTVILEGDEQWSADFQESGSNAKLMPGYYDNLSRFPFNAAATAGMAWTGQGRACNTLNGWFVVDKVSYDNDTLSAIDLRFEQHCEQGASALHGQIHWTNADPTVPPGPQAIPADLWDAKNLISTPSGSYLYLESPPGDFIGRGQSYVYTPAVSTFTVMLATNHLTVDVLYPAEDGRWTGNFVGMASLSELKPGYYAGLERYPFNNAVKGGLDWSGFSRGCNGLSGWFAIDQISTAGGQVTAVDLRFEQRCDGGPPLHGKLHWVQP